MNHLVSRASRVSTVARPVLDAPPVLITEFRVELDPADPNHLPADALPSTYTSKPLVLIEGESLFGELAVVRLLQMGGWGGVWVDSFHSSARRQLFWDDMPHRSAPFDLHLVPRARDIYDQILGVRSGKRGGFFDVLAWRGDELAFIEYKGPGDTPNKNEPAWLAAALSCGVAPAQLFCVSATFAGTALPQARDRRNRVSKASPSRGPADTADTIDVVPTFPSSRTPTMSQKKEPVHRRKIGSALQATHGWSVRTNVDGYVEVTPPRGARDDAFAAQVRAAVTALGYEPQVSWFRRPDGTHCVRVRTPETIAQIDRGRHRV